jgi:hypothetical protein
MTCTHDIIEKDNACADGMCPLCLAAEIKQLKGHKEEADRHITTIAELRADRERLIALLAEARGPEGHTHERVAEWLRGKGYTVVPVVDV